MSRQMDRNLAIEWPAFFLLLLPLLAHGSLFAAAHTWSGAVDEKWSVSGNWSAGGAPQPGEMNVDLTFPGPSAMVNDVVGLHISSMLFAGDCPSLTGNAIGLHGSIATVSGSGTASFAHVGLDVALEGESSFVAMSGSPISLSLDGSISGPFGVTVAGAGEYGARIIFAGANTYSGATTLTRGYFAVTNASGLGTADGSAATGTVVRDGASVWLGASVANEALSIGGSGTFPTAALDTTPENVGLLVVEWSGPVILTSETTVHGDLRISGPISGAHGLRITGRTVWLAGPNSNTGPTRIRFGTLIVDGDSSGSDFETNDGLAGSFGTLGGSGSIGNLSGGSVADERIDPGPIDATGIFSAKNVSLADPTQGSIVLVILLMGTLPGSQYDRLAASGTVSLEAAGGSGTQRARLLVTCGFSPSVDDTFTIVTAAGGVTGMFEGQADGSTLAASGQLLRINYSPTSVMLTALGPTPVELQMFEVD